ncbi:MAG: LuxR C-terminal-related transcriptional regulator, partial [Tepidiformaceae bacterium]
MTTPALTTMRERLRMDYRWTARQRQVLELIAAHKTNGEIADALDLALDTAKWLTCNHARERRLVRPPGYLAAAFSRSFACRVRAVTTPCW